MCCQCIKIPVVIYTLSKERTKHKRLSSYLTLLFAGSPHYAGVIIIIIPGSPSSSWLYYSWSKP